MMSVSPSPTARAAAAIASRHFVIALRFCVLGAAAGALALYLVCASKRLTYPWEIEWMEGGMLMHAARVLSGKPIYAKPAIEFVAFFYTPLYAWLVAGIAQLTGGVTFTLGRCVSLLSSLAIMAQLYYVGRRERGWFTGVLAAGLYAALFRVCGAFYDVARPDSFSLAIVLGASLVAYYRTSYRGAVLSAALFVCAFFAKQTTAVLFPFVGLYLLFVDFRRALLFGVTAAVLGLGGGYLLDASTDGWFRFYTVSGHQGHEFDKSTLYLGYWRDVLCLSPLLWLLPAYGASYGKHQRWLLPPFLLLLGVAFHHQATMPDVHLYMRQLWYGEWRTMLIVVPLAVAALLYAARFLEREAPAPPPFFVLLFAGGALSSALNQSTAWSYSNCYMPVALFGSLCAALCAAPLFTSRNEARSLAASSCVALAVLIQFVALYYNPRAQSPDANDRAAIVELERTLARYPGPVLMPAHPLYSYQRDGSIHLHHMGIQDVEFAGGLSDLAERLRSGQYPTVVVEDVTNIPGLENDYVPVQNLEFKEGALFSKTGLRTRPGTIWLHRSVAAEGKSGS